MYFNAVCENKILAKISEFTVYTQKCRCDPEAQTYISVYNQYINGFLCFPVRECQDAVCSNIIFVRFR